MSTTAAVALAAPWVLTPLVGLWRSRPNLQLSDFPVDPPHNAPLLSAIIPARNEQHNIEKCVRSILASSYPNLEVIIVDDHSTDDTGSIAEALASADQRVRVITPKALPSDWFGKQWACWTGAREARGEVFAFFDADTFQQPDFLGRALNAMYTLRLDLFTALGAQEMGSFWERVVQPHVFSIMLTRYGSTGRINRSKDPSDKIANGQCILITRESYFETGGHEAVRQFVAEDLALAQRFSRLGKNSAAAVAQDSFSTRMYTSLAEIIAGWSKNMFVAGADAMPGGALGRRLFPFLMLGPGIMGVAPPIGLLLGLLTGVDSLILWGTITTIALLLWWLALYSAMRAPIRYALLFPLGAAVLLWILVRALVRGRNVRWKDRDYVAVVNP